MTEVTNEREYHAAVRRVYELMIDDPPPESPAGKELVQLAEAVERFEDNHLPLSCCAVSGRECAVRLLALFRKLGAFYDLAQAVEWCETPQPLLDGQRPVDMLATDEGAADVDALVTRLRDGAHA